MGTLDRIKTPEAIKKYKEKIWPKVEWPSIEEYDAKRYEIIKKYCNPHRDTDLLIRSANPLKYLR